MSRGRAHAPPERGPGEGADWRDRVVGPKSITERKPTLLAAARAAGAGRNGGVLPTRPAACCPPLPGTASQGPAPASLAKSDRETAPTPIFLPVEQRPVQPHHRLHRPSAQRCVQPLEPFRPDRQGSTGNKANKLHTSAWPAAHAGPCNRCWRCPRVGRETRRVVVEAMESMPAGFSVPLNVESRRAGRGQTANEAFVNWLQMRFARVGRLLPALQKGPHGMRTQATIPYAAAVGRIQLTKPYPRENHYHHRHRRS